MTNQNEYQPNEADKDNRTFIVIESKEETQNNSGIFICLPQNLCVPRKADFEADLVKQTEAALEEYYEPFGVEVHYTTQPNTAEVYVMDSAKHQSYSYDDEIKIKIKNIINEMLGKEYAVKIKLNYAAFDPNFTPVSSNIDINQDTTDKSDSAEFNYKALSMNYQAEMPSYSFNQVVLPEATKNEIERAIGVLNAERKVFDEWGLRTIIPYASSAIGFYGPPGTGKTMTAEAIAQKLGRKIISATYADITSKYFGVGAKMIKALFMAAERENAVLFIDEADVLLSKRQTDISDATQALNAIKSQLLITLEKFKGIAIFATNLIVNYDSAFLSRLKNIEFTMPDKNAREKIWWNHLKTDKVHIPLNKDVNISKIAKDYEFCGRDIKNAVKDACISAVLKGRDIVIQKDLIEACELAKTEIEKVAAAKDYSCIQSAAANIEKQNVLKNLISKK